MRNREARPANRPRVTRRVGPAALLVGLVGLAVAAAAQTSTSGPTFYDDDPIDREPETQDASGRRRTKSGCSTRCPTISS